MRILLVNAHGADLAYGGAERYVHDLRTGLEHAGEESAVLSAFPTRADSSSELHVLHATDWREDRVRRFRNHAADWVAPASDRMTERLRTLAPDLVHSSNLPGITTGIWECARRLGIPVVHTPHDYALMCPRTTLMRRDGTPCAPHPLLCGMRTRSLARWAPAVDEVIGISAHLLAAHDGWFEPTTGTQVILPPLAAVTDPRGGALPAPGPALRTLGFTGALSPHKGVAMLLSAAPGLAELGIRLRVAGGGPMQEAVAGAPGVEYAGRLTGPALVEFMAGCDAGIVPSLWEEPGLTFSALEWLGAGRPVLTTARGGLAELPLGAVAPLTGAADDLLTRATALREPDAFAAWVAGLPAVDGERDRRRWIDAHRDVYARAFATRSAAGPAAGGRVRS
jgi:glycosyltransferase involved in cell wall biosynthesis